ncbi:MAG TPA: AI-2E family transporter [Thermoanaerobaculia bacterium]|nr:AI-2E family transporter [Thermoanaerobaculia bacterium]
MKDLVSATDPAPRLNEPAAPPGGSVVRTTLQVLMVLLAVGAALWALSRLQGVLLLLILAVFFAYLIAPLVGLLQRPVTLKGRRRSLPLPLAVGVVYLLIFGSLALALWILLPVVSTQLSELTREVPGYIARGQARLRAWESYERSHLPAEIRGAVQGSINQALKAAGDSLKSGILPWIAGALAYVPWLVLVPILALFLLKDAELFRTTALRLFPKGRLRWRGDDFFQDVNSTLAAYVRAQLIACAIVGIACTTGFALIGVPHAMVLGIGAGLLEFIPLAGPLTIGAIAVTFAAFSSAGQALSVLAFLVILRLGEDYVVYPRIIGHGIHLHPLAVIVAILCGAELAGLVGVFLSIPAVAVLSVAFRHWREHLAKEAEHAVT